MIKLSIAIDPDKLIPDSKQGMITESGTFYRKGTSLATFDNAKTYQSLIDKGIKDIADPNIQTAINDQRFITNMMAVGLYFSFFPEADWLTDEKQEGRMMPALLMLQQYPNKLSNEIQQRLLMLKKIVSPITQSLIDETLEYHEKYLSKLEATKKYLSHLFMEYVKGLENQDIAPMQALWLDKSDSCLIVPSSDTPIRGKTNILAFTQNNYRNFVKLTFEVSNLQVDVDLTKGIAHLYALKKLDVNLKEDNAFKGKPIPTRAIVNVEFVRLETPSCTPILKGFENWRLGNWKISNWTEVFPYSQF